VILTGKEIEKRLGTDIIISDFNKDRLNPNSYNLRLHHVLATYKTIVVTMPDGRGGYETIKTPIDLKKNNPVEELIIPDSGLVLEPGKLYLGRTIEYTETSNLVPMLEGRSSLARAGIFIHATAGFGDIGFKGTWTLEISVVQPVRIYPNMEVCQIYYHTLLGDIEEYKSSKYQGQKGIVPSMMWTELNKEKKY
jgi:dCTP deaminase